MCESCGYGWNAGSGQPRACSKCAKDNDFVFQDGDLAIHPSLSLKDWDGVWFVVHKSKIQAMCPGFLEYHAAAPNGIVTDPDIKDFKDDDDASSIVSVHSESGDTQHEVEEPIQRIHCAEDAKVIEVVLAFCYDRGDLLDLSKVPIVQRIGVWCAALQYKRQALLLYVESSIICTALELAAKAREANRDSFVKQLLPLTLKQPFSELAVLKSKYWKGEYMLAELSATDVAELAGMHVHAALSDKSYQTSALAAVQSIQQTIPRTVASVLCPNHQPKFEVPKVSRSGGWGRYDQSEKAWF